MPAPVRVATPGPVKTSVHAGRAVCGLLPRPLGSAGVGGGHTQKKSKANPNPQLKKKHKQKNRLPSRVRVGQNARLEKNSKLLEV
jgi:hypothetical protein